MELWEQPKIIHQSYLILSSFHHLRTGGQMGCCHLTRLLQGTLYIKGDGTFFTADSGT